MAEKTAGVQVRSYRDFRSTVGPADIDDLARAIQKAWSAESSNSRDWTPDAPHRGQADVTALIVQYAYGGVIETAQINGVYHYWNVISRVSIDLSQADFPADSTFVYKGHATAGLMHAAEERFNTLKDRIRI